jgi:hypothetical protein
VFLHKVIGLLGATDRVVPVAAAAPSTTTAAVVGTAWGRVFDVAFAAVGLGARGVAAVPGRHQEARRIAAADRVVGGVGVAIDLLGVGEFQDRVDGDEAARRGVVFAGAEMGEAGGCVLDSVDEASLPSSAVPKVSTLCLHIATNCGG